MHRFLSLLAAVVLATSGLAQTTVRILPVAAFDVVADPAAGRLYAAVPDGATGSSVVAVDPVSGAVTATLSVPGRPFRLALSDDGTALYVGLLDLPAVARIDVASWTEVARFDLGTGSLGTLYANDLEVQPGRPDVVAVSRRSPAYSPSHEGVAIYENGVRRADVTQPHTGSNVIEFGATPGRLYGYNTETSEFGFRRLSVDASGVREVSVDDSFTNALISGYGVDIVFSAGRIYSSNGAVVDAEGRRSLGTVATGAIAGDPYPSLWAVRPAPDLDRVVYLAGTNGAVVVAAFDATSLASLGTVPVPNGAPADEYGRTRLVRWGARGLAYAGAQGLVLLESAVFDPALAGIATSPGAVDFGRITGPAERALVVGNPGDAPLRVSAVTSDVPGLTFSPSTFEVAPGATVTGRVLLTPRAAGYVTGTLTFATNGLGGHYAIPVSADADVTVLSYGARELAFGEAEVGSESIADVYVYNPSTRPVQISTVRTEGPFEASLSAAMLSPYGAASLRVTFRPEGGGAVTGRVIIGSDADISPDTLALSGTGVRLARLALEPGYLALGDVVAGRTVEAAVVVRNVGTAPLHVAAVRPDGPFSFAPGAFDLAPGDSLAGTVQFVAARIGGNAGALAFESNAVTAATLYVGANVVQATDAAEGPVAVDALLAPSPNPVRGASRVAFTTATPGRVRLAVYDALGRRVRDLVDADRPAGPGEILVEAGVLPAGVYMVRMESPGFVASRALTVVR
ncbi:choice-of-anchor D domain-containing protein [Rubrivirga sp. IMCC45206]|uniref:choice-of-anchor D domain-containing protein n=1 Tax=Rubrivirga sp. IMCC45206 TaxID=3391614 RepID=UPI0039900C9A